MATPRYRRRKKTIWPVLILLAAAAICLSTALVAFMMPQVPPRELLLEASEAEPIKITPEASSRLLAKNELAGLIGARSLEPDERQIFEITDRDGQVLFVRTTLLPGLQAQALERVNSCGALTCALVALNPTNGEVLALADYRADGAEGNAALAGSFPAASLFKIVTAAAVLEKAELHASSTVAYDGGKHTLYKSNVIKEPDQGRQAATLKTSFAESINTVFGKLGAFTLGPEELAAFASRFYFNQNIDFEMPVETSRFALNPEEDLFRLAELASGYNRETTVSPLHGALLASSVAAEGRLWPPAFVREVFDRDNNIHYLAEPAMPKEIMAEATALEMKALMEAAITEGTGRKTFADAAEHPVLSKLEIGGKSGSINNNEGQRVDWFVAWTRPLSGQGPELALSAVVVHDGKANTSSQKLVREAIIAFYQDHNKNI